MNKSKDDKKGGRVIIFTVSLLGRFQILYQGNILSDDDIRSEKLVNLFSYIVLHRERSLSVQELTEALWKEDETDNPAGALKNLMYRLRTIFKKHFGDADFIMTSRGAYYWNPEMEVVVDVELFEQNCNMGKKEQSENCRKSISHYEEAVELYQGDFLAKYIDNNWILPVSTYYHSLFLSSAKKLAELYEEEEDYQNMERVCAKALQFDKVDEQIHCLRIGAMIHQNKQKLAEEYYENAVKVLYEALGVRNTAGLKKVYKELLKMKKSSAAAAIEEIQQDMLEPEKPEGAYICGYAVFREAYRMEARRIHRLGIAEYVLLLTMTVNEETVKAGNEKMEKFLLNNAMDRMEEVLRDSLRIGDVASRYSDTQFVVLLPTCSQESSMMVISRILSRFSKYPDSRRIKVKSDIEEVTMSGRFGERG